MGKPLCISDFLKYGFRKRKVKATETLRRRGAFKDSSPCIFLLLRYHHPDGVVLISRLDGECSGNPSGKDLQTALPSALHGYVNLIALMRRYRYHIGIFRYPFGDYVHWLSLGINTRALTSTVYVPPVWTLS